MQQQEARRNSGQGLTERCHHSYHICDKNAKHTSNQTGAVRQTQAEGHATEQLACTLQKCRCPQQPKGRDGASAHRWTEGQTKLARPCEGRALSLEEEGNSGRHGGHCAQGHEPVTRGQTPCDATCLRSPEEPGSWRQRAGGGHGWAAETGCGSVGTELQLGKTVPEAMVGTVAERGACA